MVQQHQWGEIHDFSVKTRFAKSQEGER